MFKEVYKELSGNSLRVQWLGLQASTAGGQGSITGQETKILHPARCGEGWGGWWRVEKKCGCEDTGLVARDLLVVVVLFSKIERS